MQQSPDGMSGTQPIDGNCSEVRREQQVKVKVVSDDVLTGQQTAQGHFLSLVPFRARRSHRLFPVLNVAGSHAASLAIIQQHRERAQGQQSRFDRVIG